MLHGQWQLTNRDSSSSSEQAPPLLDACGELYTKSLHMQGTYKKPFSLSEWVLIVTQLHFQQVERVRKWRLISVLSLNRQKMAISDLLGPSHPSSLLMTG